MAFAPPAPPCPLPPTFLALPGAGTRRAWLRQMGAASLAMAALPAPALPAKLLQFPRDFGSHPAMQTEWWYITGHVQADQRLWGFQLTFFRSRVAATQAMRSAFAAKQLVFAHAALCDVASGQMLHDQAMAREGFGLASASTQDTDLRLQGWRLWREAVAGQDAAQASRYHTRIATQAFALELQFDTSQAVLLQGKQGLSRKGPDQEQASYYYSQPQLSVTGSIVQAGRRMAITTGSRLDNRAWLDHECSDALMHPEAVGWDWIGMNLDDGSALTAFHLRRSDGSTLWSGGSWRAAPTDHGLQPPTQSFSAGQVQFEPMQYWQSPDSQARYPVVWRVTTPVGHFEVRALTPAQELDSRASTGTIYWEGLCDLLRLTASGAQRAGRGYLEMTGYAHRLRTQ